MGRYLFENDKVHFWNSRGQGVVSWAEFASSDMAHDRQAHILLAAEEGAERHRLLREIKKMLIHAKVLTLVPYTTALCSFLNERGLFTEDRIFMVLDDLGEKFALSVLLRTQVLAMRMIRSQDLHQVIEEIIRTQKSVVEPKGNLPWRILSNHEGLMKALSGASIALDLVPLETFLPAMQVLGCVKFNQMLMTPEEAQLQKKHIYGWRLAGSVVLAIGLAGAGLLFYGRKLVLLQRVNVELKVLETESLSLDEALRLNVTAGYQDYIRRLSLFNLAVTVDDLKQSMSETMRVESVDFIRGDDGGVSLQAKIGFEDGRFSPWRAKGIWQKAVCEPFWHDGRAGFKAAAKQR